MNVQEHLMTLIEYFKTNPLIAGAVALLLLLFFARYPKGFLKTALVIAVALFALNLISHMTSTGKSYKDKAYESSEGAFNPNE
jgi:hypothetical protein